MQFLFLFQALPLLFPVLFFVLIFSFFRRSGCDPLLGFRYAVLGTLLTLFSITEVLSLFRAITFEGVLYSWVAVCLIAGFFARPDKILWKEGFPLKHFWKNQKSIFFLVLIGILVIPVLFLALFCPPNNWDAMAYHLPRMAQWWSRASVAHYPTNNLYQLTHPALSEYILLHIYGLTGGDSFLNLPQFLSWVGLPVLFLFWTKEEGVPFSWPLAAIVSLSLPTGILQASTAKNDLLLSFLAVNLLISSCRFRQNEKPGLSAIELGVSLGLFLFTKGSAYLLALPILAFALSGRRVWYFLSSLVLAGGINLPYYARNLLAFGNPLPSGGERFFVEHISLLGLGSNLIKNLSLQMNLPSIPWTDFLNRFVLKLHELMGVSVQDLALSNERSGFSLQPLYFYEDYDGNSLFFILVVCVSIWSFVKRSKRQEVILFWSGFLLISLLRWKSWNARLQLPLFYLMVPAVVTAFSSFSINAKRGLAVVLVLFAVPYLIWNPLKPILSSGKSAVSVFDLPRPVLYFSGRTAIYPKYRELFFKIEESGCRSIALQSDNDSYEFPFWALLGAPSTPLHIRHVGIKNESSNFLETTPEPCATISVL